MIECTYASTILTQIKEQNRGENSGNGIEEIKDIWEHYKNKLNGSFIAALF